jgi:hypothetical protein
VKRGKYVNMSKNDVTVSPEERDGANPDSVFDFLYHDSRRIGSFLSQFDSNGLLTGIGATDTSAKGSKRGYKVGVGGEMPLLGGGKLEFEREPAESGSETLERSYDPFWANALTLLDFLEERRLIVPQIEEANFGQFVLVRGWLSVLDLSMFKQAWSLPSVQKAARAGQPQSTLVDGNRHERRKQGKTAPAPAQMPSEVDLMLDLMGVLPHTVHASIMTEHDTVWANLRDEFMVTPAAELVLTHGASLPGEWAMLGILSGRPDIGETALQQALAEGQGNLPAGLVNSAIGVLARTMAPMIRTALGRPANSYAVTPLLIFRGVNEAA